MYRFEHLWLGLSVLPKTLFSRLNSAPQVMQFKLGTPERQEALRAMWLVRLKGGAATRAPAAGSPLLR